ncbi:MAG: hypothetical protein ACW99A_18640 [Candidatus Kariarchaeaceae archaeon]|jgi:hypothetical protein
MTTEVFDKEIKPQKPKDERKIVRFLEDNSIKVIDPLKQDFSQNERIVTIKEITNWDKLIMLLAPNSGEIARLFVSLGITYVVSLLLQFPFLSFTMIKFYGMAALSVYGYTWAFAGPSHYAARNDRIRKELHDGKEVVVEIKLFGFIISIIIIYFGILLN